MPEAMIHLMFAPRVDDDVPPTLLDIANDVFKEHPTNFEKHEELFLQKLSFKDSQIIELEKGTRSQVHSNFWWNHRKGRITASKFHDVHTKVQTLLKN